MAGYPQAARVIGGAPVMMTPAALRPSGASVRTAAGPTQVIQKPLQAGSGLQPSSARVVAAPAPVQTTRPASTTLISPAVRPTQQSPAPQSRASAPITWNGPVTSMQQPTTQAASSKPSLPTAAAASSSDSAPQDQPMAMGQSETLKTALKTLNAEHPAWEIDVDAKTRYTVRELRHIVAILKSPSVMKQYASSMFRKSDVDNNGVLSFEELQELIPRLHQELGIRVDAVGGDQTSLVRKRMRKFDMDGNGVLDENEFLQLYRWTLWRRYEDIDPPLLKRGQLLGASHQGSPSQFYDISSELGQGQFGVVHKVVHRSTGMDRVLKTINKHTAVQSGTPLALLNQEIEILALLDHPHILRLFEHYEDAYNLYLVTDVCYGGDLLGIVEDHANARRPLPEAWVARVFSQALEAIAYCHSKGVMHKDLKFENLMLRTKVTAKSALEDISVVVIDVGLSELFGPQHQKNLRSDVIAGSPATMAPEVIARDFSYKCDIWSLGCLLYAIFNCQPSYLPDGAGGQVLYTYPFAPVPTETDPFGIEGLLMAQVRGPPMEQLANVSKQARQVVIAMLTCDEGQRPTAKGCLVMPWFSQAALDRGAIQLSEDQVKTLLRDQEVSTWRRTVMLEAATQVPINSVQELEKEFEALAHSTGQVGFIDRQVLAEALQRQGVAPAVALQAADAADLDGSGQIEWTEFVAALLPASHSLFASALQGVFQDYDLNQDGHLDRNEVAALLTSGKIDRHMPTKRTVDMIIQDIDTNHDGRISFSEFHSYLLHADTLS